MSIEFAVDIEEIAKEIKRVASQSEKEEDLRLGVEYVLRNKVIEKLKEIEKAEIFLSSSRPIIPRPRYEVTLVSGRRVDALYGTLVIEYKKPGTFDTRSGFERAVEEVKQYIRDLARDETKFSRYFGVVIDGYKIGFVRYREADKDFEVRGPFDVNKNTVAKLIEAIIGLGRKALSAEELLKDFGPGGEGTVAGECVKTLYSKLLGPTTPKTRMLFEDWRRVFSQIVAYSPEKIRGIEEFYGFKKGSADPEKLLFAIHTYYALIMKLLAAEVASLYVTPKLWSYLKTLEDAYYKGPDKLREELKELEEGGIFSKLGIVNFLEADYFAWYLDEWNEEVAKCVMSVINRLSSYDPSVAELEPDRVKDLFKRLYQNLVPKKIRHDLGEYYTPDWLAELVLDEVGWTRETFEKIAQELGPLAPLELRLLDPACGSGTFLILAISRLRQYIEEHWIDKGTALKKITKNIVGFDINPLAVIASRVNYLISLGDMLREKGDETIEIPVYLADSILVKRESKITGTVYVLKTAVGEFNIPISVVEKGLHTKVLSIVEECIRMKCKPNEFRERLNKEVKLEQTELLGIMDLFNKLLNLEEEGRDRIWIRILKNSFAPFLVGKFDYVVGNPPWVNWENLPDDFRKTLKELYRSYSILPEEPNAQQKIDLSMIFTYRCMDEYLKDNGMFGFLINDAAFKAMAGSGFRKFKIGDTPFKVTVIHDLVDIKPFEGASNRTAMFVAKKGEETVFPVPYKKWFKVVKGEIPQNLSLRDVMSMVKILDFYAEPLGGYRPYGDVEPFVVMPNKDDFNIINKIIGRSYYEAHEGANLLPAGVFRVKIKNKSGNLLTIENLHDKGKRQKVDRVTDVIEEDLVFPILESGDVKRWRVSYSSYAIIPHDLKTTNPIPESQLKVKYPKTYEYFAGFKKLLEQRSDYKSYGKNRLPFYFVYRLSDYTLKPYKVVWNQMGSRLDAAVATPVYDKYLGPKPLVPEHVIAFIAVERECEAHYICAILNSSLVNFVLKSIAKGGKNFATPEFINRINIKKFEASNTLHNKLVDLSRKAHQLAQQDNEEELRKVEEEIDKTVAELYGLTDDELKEIKRSLAILDGLDSKEVEKE